MFDYMSDFLTSPYIVPVVAIMAGIGFPIVTSAWSATERHKQECQLKREMIARGMSVEEIERVLAATTPSNNKE